MSHQPATLPNQTFKPCSRLDPLTHFDVGSFGARLVESRHHRPRGSFSVAARHPVQQYLFSILLLLLADSDESLLVLVATRNYLRNQKLAAAVLLQQQWQQQ
jgi:hypothetical protein